MVLFSMKFDNHIQCIFMIPISDVFVVFSSSFYHFSLVISILILAFHHRFLFSHFNPKLTMLFVLSEFVTLVLYLKVAFWMMNFSMVDAWSKKKIMSLRRTQIKFINNCSFSLLNFTCLRLCWISCFFFIFHRNAWIILFWRKNYVCVWGDIGFWKCHDFYTLNVKRKNINIATFRLCIAWFFVVFSFVVLLYR